MKLATTVLNNSFRIILLSAALFFALTAVSFANANHVSVKGDNVNIRTGPSKNKPVYMELSKGYPLVVIKRQRNWVKVKDFEGDTGWIHSSLVEKGKTVIVNSRGKKVNMRSGPSTRNKIVAEVYRGVVLTKVGRKGRWLKLKHDDGVVGWIYKPLLWP